MPRCGRTSGTGGAGLVGELCRRVRGLPEEDLSQGFLFTADPALRTEDALRALAALGAILLNGQPLRIGADSPAPPVLPEDREIPLRFGFGD